MATTAKAPSRPDDLIAPLVGRRVRVEFVDSGTAVTGIVRAVTKYEILIAGERPATLVIVLKHAVRALWPLG